MAKIVARKYPESKARNPGASEAAVIKDMGFHEGGLAGNTEDALSRIEICCETIQGFCYMAALDAGRMKGMLNIRSLQFTHYMDVELAAAGFPPQTREQKERILEAMELRMDGWERWTGD